MEGICVETNLVETKSDIIDVVTMIKTGGVHLVPTIVCSTQRTYRVVNWIIASPTFGKLSGLLSFPHCGLNSAKAMSDVTPGVLEEVTFG